MDPLFFASDPIAALATPPGRSGVAVIRLSGTHTLERLLPFLRTPAGTPLTPRHCPPRQLTLCWFRDPEGNTALDQCLVVHFPPLRSYTGEEMAELHCHGSPVITRRILELLSRGGFRAAQPGEFSRRAFLNGKLDLIQAEGVVQLVEAATLGAARHAARQLSGALSGELTPLRSRLVELLALMEAHLDFADEEIDPLDREATDRILAGARDTVATLLRRSEAGRRLEEGYQVVIAGSPNVGKSTLFNRLAGQERAIVTPIPGTTRDLLELPLELAGFPVTLVDTAGLRTTLDPVEAEGVRRAHHRAFHADLVLFLLDPSRPLEPAEEALLRDGFGGVPWVRVWNKWDLTADSPLPGAPPPAAGCLGEVRLSALGGTGVEGLLELLERLPALVGEEGATGWEGEHPLMLAHRQRGALERAREALGETGSLLAGGLGLEIAVVPLREALRELGTVVGEGSPEEMLDALFGAFCIGK